MTNERDQLITHWGLSGDALIITQLELLRKKRFAVVVHKYLALYVKKLSNLGQRLKYNLHAYRADTISHESSTSLTQIQSALTISSQSVAYWVTIPAHIVYSYLTICNIL